MKFTIIFAFYALTCLAATTFAAISKATSIRAAQPPTATLAQDIEELSRLVPTKMLLKLITRYLMNDAEFQTVVRTLNSYDAFIVRMRIRSQPEVMAFQSWLRQQLLMSGDSLELSNSMELDIFDTSPYWANNVYGWQGFVNEFLSYFPQDLLRAHIDMKVAENGTFAQFWARVQALKPVYERILALPETQRLIATLQAIGVDTNQLDQFIRTQFDWLNSNASPRPAVGGIAG